MDFPINPILIPLVGVISIMVTGVVVVAIVFWFKARDKELQYHQDLRVREMQHLQKMKELEIELEKAKGRSSTSQAA
jgi:hypothetical protein